MTLEAQDRVKVYPEFENVNMVKKDPLPLFIIVKQKYMGVSGVVTEVEICRRRNAYNHIVMQPTETLQEYKDRFRHAIEAIVAIGLVPPAENEQGAQFL